MLNSPGASFDRERRAFGIGTVSVMNS